MVPVILTALARRGADLDAGANRPENHATAAPIAIAPEVPMLHHSRLLLRRPLVRRGDVAVLTAVRHCESESRLTRSRSTLRSAALEYRNLGSFSSALFRMTSRSAGRSRLS